MDTNPVEFPTRLLGRPLSPANRFAKVATVVTKLYSEHLDTGKPLLARTSWVRFIPTDLPGPAPFSPIPADGSLGLGEVHEVPFDATVPDLPDHERRTAVLDWLHANMLGLAKALNWDEQPLTDAFEACRGERCVLRKRGRAKTSPDRRHKTYAEFDIDGEGDAWSWVVVTDPAGGVLATSDRRDTPPTLTAARTALKSVRWDGGAVTWTPWTDDLAPRGQAWVGHVERFAF